MLIIVLKCYAVNYRIWNFEIKIGDISRLILFLLFSGITFPLLFFVMKIMKFEENSIFLVFFCGLYSLMMIFDIVILRIYLFILSSKMKKLEEKNLIDASKDYMNRIEELKKNGWSINNITIDQLESDKQIYYKNLEIISIFIKSSRIPFVFKKAKKYMPYFEQSKKFTKYMLFLTALLESALLIKTFKTPLEDIKKKRYNEIFLENRNILDNYDEYLSDNVQILNIEEIQRLIISLDKSYEKIRGYYSSNAVP